MTRRAITRLQHGRVALALHTLQHAEGLPLLLLHELGGAASDWREQQLPWSGPVFALDLSGHGHSGRLHGAGYYAELWAADADVALALLGQAVVLGAGLGAYVALLLAGGRPDQVHAAVLSAGAGLMGGGALPDFDRLALPDLASWPGAGELCDEAVPDPSALAAADLHVRPPDYAARFAAAARRLVLVEAAAALPPWWEAVAGVPGVLRCDSLPDALRRALRDPSRRP